MNNLIKRLRIPFGGGRRKQADVTPRRTPEWDSLRPDAVTWVPTGGYWRGAYWRSVA